MTHTSEDRRHTPKREEPETFRARAVTVSLTVNDIQKSIVWYRDIAAFVIDETWEQDGKLLGATLKAGSVQLWLAQDDGGRGVARPKGEGFSLTFTTVMDVDKLASDMQSRGAVLDSAPADMPWGARSFRVRDPDGVKLSFSKDKA